MRDDARADAEPDALRRIVVEMLAEGFTPCVLVFIDRAGSTRIFHREDLDADEILRMALRTPVPDSGCH